MRVETFGSAILYLADCRELLQARAGDTVITDPVWPNCPPDSVTGSDDPWGLWRSTMAAMPPMRRLVVVMRCDSDPRFLSAIPDDYPFFRSIQMTYAVPMYLGQVLGGDETAYWYGEPIRKQRGRMVVPGRGPVAQPRGRPANGHPMSRAQVHFDWLVHWASDDGETVLDPFMGSGTTGVACAKLGRSFVGVEIDPHFFDIACARIEAAAHEPDLFKPALPAEAPSLALSED